MIPSCRPYTRCRKVTCEYCAAQKGRRIAGVLQDITGEDDLTTYLSVTLTVPLTSNSLRKQIAALLASFRGLRRRSGWAHSITGGAYSLHAKYKEVYQAWNVHLHVLAQGWTTHTDTIAHDWLTLTSGRLLIKRIGSDDYRCAMARYVAKPGHDTLFKNAALLEQYVEETHRLRLRGTFGAFRGRPLLPRSLRAG